VIDYASPNMAGTIVIVVGDVAGFTFFSAGDPHVGVFADARLQLTDLLALAQRWFAGARPRAGGVDDRPRTVAAPRGVGRVRAAGAGRGRPLFPRRVLHPALRLVSVQPMGAGMVELRYEFGGVDTEPRRDTPEGS